MTSTPQLSKTQNKVQDFLSAGSPENLVLTLDGPGVNGAMQYEVLSSIGKERLNKLKQVNVLSASTYAYLCFQAYHQNALKFDHSGLLEWDSYNRKAHAIVPGLSLLKTIGSLVGVGKALPSAGFAAALAGIIDFEKFPKTIAGLPANVCFWLYDSEAKQVIPATPQNELKDMLLVDLIKGAPSVPKVFQPLEYQGRRYSDPVYAPIAKDFYQSLRKIPCDRHLFANVFKGGAKEKMLYLKVHGHKNGGFVLMRDLLLFLTGMRNPALARCIESGLLKTQSV